MKRIYLLLLLFSILASLSSCDTEGNFIDTGYNTFGGVKILWQADNTIKYKLTLDGDSISKVYYPSDKTKGILKVFKNDETTPELETEVAINGKQVELVQMPESPIMLAANNDETNPSNRNSVKVRFFIPSNFNDWANSVQVDIYATVDKKNYTPTGKSLTLEKGKLSDYVELNLNMFFPESSNTVTFNFDVKDMDGNILVDHTASKSKNNQILFQSGSSKLTDTGWEPINKFATTQMEKKTAGSNVLYRFLYKFGTSW